MEWTQSYQYRPVDGTYQEMAGVWVMKQESQSRGKYLCFSLIWDLKRIMVDKALGWGIASCQNQLISTLSIYIEKMFFVCTKFLSFCPWGKDIRNFDRIHFARDYPEIIRLVLKSCINIVSFYLCLQQIYRVLQNRTKWLNENSSGNRRFYLMFRSAEKLSSMNLTFRSSLK